MSNVEYYSELFDYLRVEDLPTSPEPAVVFGRNDVRVAHAAGDLALASLAETIVISGGVGKDTGDLLEQGYGSEAEFLKEVLSKDAAAREYTLPYVFLDEAATHGGENAANSVRILQALDYSVLSLTGVIHATSARRLTETLRLHASQQTGQDAIVHVKPTDYPFNTSSPVDRKEAIGEMVRLIQWPAQGLLPPQDLPENLVDFAIDQQQES